ncbi:MAG: ammonium transporter, partial [Gemmataceae bacterium]
RIGVIFLGIGARMTLPRLSVLLAFLAALVFLTPAALAEDPPKGAEPDPTKTPAMKADVDAVKAEAAKGTADATTAAHKYSDISWMLISTALVMLMMPGLALFYGGMARRKNVLGTMMHTFIALGLIGVQWVCIGYSLSFGDSKQGMIGFSPELCFLSTEAAVGSTPDDELKAKKIDPASATDAQKKEEEEAAAKKSRFKTFPNTNLPLYLHAMFQGMFAIITVALISGAFAERVKFGSYCLFALFWTTLVYDPIAHWVWSFAWDKAKPEDALFPAAGYLGSNGAIDFAGGTVVHIAAGVSGLAATLLLRKRIGYGKQTFHPNSMILTLLGAGLLWFGWFGFNGGSALYSNPQAVSAFTVTQVAAATAGLVWTLVEWAHRKKPTALGFASGLVAGLVAITPASGFVDPKGALIIGVAAGFVCYWAVAMKGVLGYDDSLDAFGIHGVGGFLGAILTGLLVSLPLWVYGSEMKPDQFPGKLTDAKDAVDVTAQVFEQFRAAGMSAVYAFVVTSLLVLAIDKTIGFTVKPKDEAAGLDLSQHGEVGLDVGQIEEELAMPEPKAAAKPPTQFNGGSKRFAVVVDGADPKELHKVWSDLCKPGEQPPAPEFVAVYKHLTTVSGNKFRFSGGDPVEIKKHLAALFTNATDVSVTTRVEH